VPDPDHGRRLVIDDRNHDVPFLAQPLDGVVGGDLWRRLAPNVIKLFCP
jgi:hypothetical protein